MTRFTLLGRAALTSSLLAVALASLVLPATAMAATPPITFNMQVFGPCLSGSATAGATITVVWRDSTNTIKAKGTASHPYDNGYWEMCDTSGTLAVMPGDQIKVSDGSYTRQYTVPNLSLNIDRVNDKFWGTGPAGRTVRLWIQTGDFGRGHSIRVGSDGTWTYQVDYDLVHVTFGYAAQVSWTSPNDDALYTQYLEVPYLQVTIGKSTFVGDASPITDVNISLSSSHSASASVTSDGDGIFSGELRGGNEKPVKVNVGDHISALALGSDADWIVPQIDGAADVATDVVSGQCHDAGNAGGIVYIAVTRTGHQVGWTTETTASDGTFSVDMKTVGDFINNPSNVKHGDKITIGCQLNTGDVVQYKFVTP